MHCTVLFEWTFDAVFAPCTQRTDAECVASLVRFLPSRCIRWESWSYLTPWITSLILQCYIDCGLTELSPRCIYDKKGYTEYFNNYMIFISIVVLPKVLHLSESIQKPCRNKVLLGIHWKGISAKLAHFMDQMSSPRFDRLTCKNCTLFTCLMSHVACTHQRSNFSFMFFMLINCTCP